MRGFSPGTNYRVTRTRRENNRRVREKCTPKVMHRTVGIGQPSIRVRKGEKSTGFSPVITFEILESGEVARAYIKRSSGIADIDQYALRSIRVTRYNRRPGCGTIESHADVTIDFR